MADFEKQRGKNRSSVFQVAGGLLLGTGWAEGAADGPDFCFPPRCRRVAFKGLKRRIVW